MANSILLQCLLGMQCQDFAIIAADQINTQSIIVMKDDEDKLLQISDKLVMGVNGDTADMAQFTQFIAKNIQLYEMRNGYQLDTAAVVHFTRKNLAEAMKGGNPYMVNSLMAGYDEKVGSQLYTMDFIASCVKVPFAAHGFGGILAMGILDRYYKLHLTEAEAYEILKMCVHEIQSRLFINLPKFQVKVVSKKGISTLPAITTASFIQNH
ncbi:proteasome subunit beta type-2-like [Achroia grisella]|uniref:proteasome subunit beta type-2-like n=1 Tax=Achroia grisella TaxID=688607 RepID=UPI0027D24649|nr:proteasome subunit beta type-2-like [Achroia grisella]